MFEWSIIKREVIQFFENPKKKVLLLLSDHPSSDGPQLVDSLNKDSLSASHIDLTQLSQASSELLETLSLKKVDGIVLSGFGQNGDFQNIFTRFGLESLASKVIVVCDQSLLHPTLDSAIYFAPINNGRVQRHLFSKVELPTKHRREREQLESVQNKSSSLSPVKPEVKVDLRAHFLNQKLMTNDPIMMQMLADRVLVDEAYKDFLFKLIYASCDDEKIRIAAANAITVLSYSRVSFSGMDLSGIKIPYADLSFGILDSTSLRNANLRGVKLMRAFLRNADFEAADLEEVDWGEKPSVSLDSYPNDMSYNAVSGRVAIAVNESIEIWDHDLTNRISFLQGHRDQVLGTDFSVDGQLIVSTGKDRTVRLWSIQDSKELMRLKAGQRTIYDVKMNFSGEWVVTAGSDKTVRVWSIKDKNEIACLNGHSQSVRTIDLTPDNKIIISGSKDSKIGLWSFAMKTNIGWLRGHKGTVYCVQASPNNLLIASGGYDKTIRIWSIHDLQQIACFNRDTHSIKCISFSSDSKMLASGCYDSGIRIWLVDEEKEVVCLEGHTSDVRSIKFHSSGKWLISTSADKSVRQWAVPTNNESMLHVGHVGAMIDMSVNSSNNLLVSVGGDNMLYLWSLSELIPHFSMRTGHSTPSSVAVSNRGNIIAMGDKQGKLKLWLVADKRLFWVSKEHSGSINSIAFSPNDEFIATASNDRTVRLWHRKNNMQCICLNGHDWQVHRVIFNNSGQFLYSGGEDGKIICWSVATGKKLFDFPNNSRTVDSMTLSRSNRLLAIGSSSKHLGGAQEYSPSVIIYALESKRQIKSLQLVEFERRENSYWNVSSIAFSFDETLLVAAFKKNIWIWSTENYQCLNILSCHHSGISTIAFDNFCNLITSGHDNMIFKWRQNQTNSWLVYKRTGRNPSLYVEGATFTNSKLIGRDKKLLTQKGAYLDDSLAKLLSRYGFHQRENSNWKQLERGRTTDASCGMIDPASADIKATSDRLAYRTPSPIDNEEPSTLPALNISDDENGSDIELQEGTRTQTASEEENSSAIGDDESVLQLSPR